MSNRIHELLHRNLQEVFGEGDATRRRVAIAELYTEDCELYMPPGKFVGVKPLTNLPVISVPHIRTSFTRRLASSPECRRSPGTGFRPARRGTRVHWLGCNHRSRWQDRGALRVPRLRPTEVTFSEMGGAIGRVEIERLFGDLSGTVSRIQHHSAYFNGLHLKVLSREIKSSPSRKLCRLPACYFVSERNSVGRIRT